jgi:hypothetical protein
VSDSGRPYLRILWPIVALIIVIAAFARRSTKTLEAAIVAYTDTRNAQTQCA